MIANAEGISFFLLVDYANKSNDFSGIKLILKDLFYLYPKRK